jgi:hypothetical protein
MAIEGSNAPHAHPPTEEQDDTVEAHYACLERPCACLEGWVFVGYIDEYGEEREAAYICCRCAESPRSPLQKMGDRQTDHPPFPPRYLPLQIAAWPLCCL